MKAIFRMIFVSAMLALSVSAFGQDNKSMGDFSKQWQERLESEKIAFLTNEMSLTPKEAQAFWPLYNQAQAAQRESISESMKAYAELDKALRSGIVHYNGAKPWREICPNMDLWWEQYRESPFYDEHFTRDFWFNQTYRLEKMSLGKRIKLVGRYFRKGGRL